MDNLSSQIDEIEALSAIYESELKVVDEYSRVYLFEICQNPMYNFELQVILPPTYPSQSSPKYEIRAPWLKSKQRINLNQRLTNIACENLGENVLYLWVEMLREFTQNEICSLANSVNSKEMHFTSNETKSEVDPKEAIPTIYHGETFTDRKSTFQAHTASVSTVEEVKLVQKALLNNRKIANASHNIVAYRICNQSNASFLQDCDDDGESAAGGRLLHLLEILDVKNVLVIVSRWYGGIKLGPDRFKHINNVARNVLLQQGFISNSAQKSTKAK